MRGVVETSTRHRLSMAHGIVLDGPIQLRQGGTFRRHDA